MATNTYYDWDSAWSSTSIDGTMADATSQTTAAISNDGKVVTEISVSVTYGGTTDQGAQVYVLRDIDGTNYETSDDKPFGFELPYSTSSTRNRVFTIAADRVSDFKVEVSNDTGDTISTTVLYRQAISNTDVV